MSRLPITSHLPFGGLFGGALGWLFGRFDHVPDPANRLNQLLRVFVDDLAPQVANIDVHDISESVVIHVPDVLHDHRAAERTAAVAHHVFEDAELLRSEVDGFGGAGDLAADAIEREVAYLE